MAFALFERARLGRAGTENYSPHLGQAAGEDFGSGLGTWGDAAAGYVRRVVDDLDSSLELAGVADLRAHGDYKLAAALDAARLAKGPLLGPIDTPRGHLGYDLGAAGVPIGGAGATGLLLRASSAARGTTTVIGKLDDLKNLAVGERSLLARLPNLRSPRANWAQNSGVLRQEMALGRPIRDASIDSTGALINNTGFLRAERALLESHGWAYNPRTTMWYPPGP
jgi:hypothetical protein